MATFSLVASAWKSTTTTAASLRAASTSRSATANGLTVASRKRLPMRLMTATRVPSAAATTQVPCPGAESG